MRWAGRGGSEDELEDVDEDEDEGEMLILGDAGCAVMRAVAGFWAAASAAATAGTMEGMSSGCRFGVGGLGGPAVTWRPRGLIWSAAVGEGGAGLRSSPSGLGWAGVLQCVRLCGFASAGGNSLPGLHSGAAGGGLGFQGCVRGACAGQWARWACHGAWGSMPWVCAGSWVSEVVKGVRRVGLWRACAVIWAGRVGPCRGARGCACVGRRVGSGEGGAGEVIARVGGVVPVYVSACRGALVWSVVGRAVWRRSLPSSAAAAQISQTNLCIWYTSWSVSGRGYASSGLRPTRRRILWMAWYPQVRECCGLGAGPSACLGLPRFACGRWRWPQYQCTVPADGQRCWIHWATQSMASPKW